MKTEFTTYQTKLGNKWLYSFLNKREIPGYLSLEQKDTFIQMLKEAGLLNSKGITPLAIAYNASQTPNEKRLYASIIILNLIRNNNTIRWYVENIPEGIAYDIRQIRDKIFYEIYLNTDCSGGIANGKAYLIWDTIETIANMDFAQDINFIDIKDSRVKRDYLSGYCSEWMLSIIYATYVIKGKGKHSEYTLSSLLKTPYYKLFCMGEEYMDPKIRRLSHSYGNLIHSCSVNEIETIFLQRKEASSQDILEEIINTISKPNSQAC